METLNQEQEQTEKTYMPTNVRVGVVWECEQCKAVAHNVNPKIVQALMFGAHVRVECPQCTAGLQLALTDTLVVPMVRPHPNVTPPNQKELKILQSLRGRVP